MRPRDCDFSRGFCFVVFWIRTWPSKGQNAISYSSRIKHWVPEKEIGLPGSKLDFKWILISKNALQQMTFKEEVLIGYSIPGFKTQTEKK